MKSNLILKQFETEEVEGTKQLKEITSFFGSKMMDIEDDIVIDNKTIQYSQYMNPSVDDNMNGFQYHNELNPNETIFLRNLVDLKNEKHTITLLQQNAVEKYYNTRWKINISIQDILKEYLFCKIKEARTFKCIRYNNFINNDINTSIYQYIKLNILNRYKFENIDFYVYYKNVPSDNKMYSQPLLTYEPLFDYTIEKPENKVTNLNIITDSYKNAINLTNIVIEYYQTKPSTEWKFDYYFNLKFTKI